MTTRYARPRCVRACTPRCGLCRLPAAVERSTCGGVGSRGSVGSVIWRSLVSSLPRHPFSSVSSPRAPLSSVSFRRCSRPLTDPGPTSATLAISCARVRALLGTPRPATRTAPPLSALSSAAPLLYRTSVRRSAPASAHAASVPFRCKRFGTNMHTHCQCHQMHCAFVDRHI